MTATYVTQEPANAWASARARFIVLSYFHLLLAVIAFAGLEWWLFDSGWAMTILSYLPLTPKGWLLVLAAFSGVAAVATEAAHNAEAKVSQYLALAGYIVAEAVIFVPMIYFALCYDPMIIRQAANATLFGFAGLTLIAFVTRKNFGALRAALCWACWCALGLMVANAFWGLDLGAWFSVGMIAVAGGLILFNTSRVIHEYDEDRYIAAALELFASIALVLWYVLRLLMRRD